MSEAVAMSLYDMIILKAPVSEYSDALARPRGFTHTTTQYHSLMWWGGLFPGGPI